VYRHILIPTDGSDLSKRAIGAGVALASALKATVTGITVSAPFRVFSVDPVIVTDTPAQYKADCVALAAKYLGVVTAEATRAGVPHEIVHVVDEEPYRAIIEAAAGKGCDLIVMASHGRKGVAALVLGSETTKVLTHSKVPVLVYR
jgi:nucleotide-binding universal stress UspA family protein